MASSVDTNLTDFKINSVASEEVLRQMEQAGLLEPNQIYMTPDEDVNLSYLRTEVIYDASDPNKQTLNGTAYTSGIVGGTKITGLDFSKYDKLFWVSCSNSSLGRYQVSSVLDKSHTNSDGTWSSAALYQETPIRMGITVTNTSLSIFDSYAGSRLIYLAGILKEPAMLYTGDELFGSDTVSIKNGVISSNIPYLETHFSSTSDQSITGSSSAAASKTIKTVNKTLPKGMYLCYLSGVIKTSSYTGDLVFNINGTDIGSTMITNTSNYAGVSLVQMHSFAGGDCTVNIKIRSRATVTMCAYSTCNFFMIRVGD